MVADLLSSNRCNWSIDKVKNYNLNVTEVRYPAFPMPFPGIFNFTVGILGFIPILIRLRPRMSDFLNILNCFVSWIQKCQKIHMMGVDRNDWEKFWIVKLWKAQKYENFRFTKLSDIFTRNLLTWPMPISSINPFLETSWGILDGETYKN